MSSKEQIIEIKKQLLEQIQQFPDDKREIAKQQIISMSAEELEEFIKQNKLIKEPKEVINNNSKIEKIQEQKPEKLENIKIPKRVP